MNSPVTFSCTCGTVTGTLDIRAPADATHAICFCRDCRAAVFHLEGADPGPDGVDYLQTTPDRVLFRTGQDQLALMTLRRKGLFRWYAACCNAPLFNTIATPQVAFATLHTNRADPAADLGPVVAKGFIPASNGKVKHKGLHKLVGSMLRRALAARLSGAWRKTPFFDPETRKPVASPVPLTAEQRRAVGI